MKRLCVFCGSSSGLRPAYVEAARLMGRALARRGLGLVYGGGRVGLMGEIASAMMQAGGEVVGVIPRAMVSRELAHEGVTELRIVRSMHERKAIMSDLSYGFVALPGGYGTLEEMCEIITWAQLGLHRKPCGILNVEGYYDSLLTHFDKGVEEGFVSRDNRKLVLEESDPDRLLDLILTYNPPSVEEWIDRDES